MNTFENKLVALVNKDIEIGVAMNAIAHMTIGLGAQLDNAILRLNDYQDKDGNLYPNISQMPFMILRGKSGEIRKAIGRALTTGQFFDHRLSCLEPAAEATVQVRRKPQFLIGPKASSKNRIPV